MDDDFLKELGQDVSSMKQKQNNGKFNSVISDSVAILQI